MRYVEVNVKRTLSHVRNGDLARIPVSYSGVNCKRNIGVLLFYTQSVPPPTVLTRHNKMVEVKAPNLLPHEFLSQYLVED